MPVLAGWLTGEQVPQEVIEHTIQTMETVLARHGGEPTRIIQPGMGLVAFADPAHSTQDQKDQSVLDWSPERRTLVYRRPLSGLHPLYYIEDWPAQGNLLFASEIKALFAAGILRRWHLPALEALLRYGFIPAPWTAIKGVSIVPAGSHLRWQHAKTLVQPGTDFTIATSTTTSPTLDHLDYLLQQASKSLLPDQNQIVALSGGSQAAALATILMAEHAQNEFPIATIGTTKTQRTKGWQEVERLATSLNLPQLAIAGSDDPAFWLATLAGIEAPCSDTRALALHQLLHVTAAETGAHTVLTGLGAYMLSGEKADPQGSKVLSSYRSKGAESALWSKDAYNAIQHEPAWEETLYARRLSRQTEQFADPLQSHYYFDLHTSLPDRLIAPYQQLAQQEGMDLQSPYLHIPVIQALVNYTSAIILTTEPEQRVLTALLRRRMPTSSERPTQLPLAIPQPALSNTGLQVPSDLVEQMLSPEALQKTGIFSYQEVQKLRLHSTAKTPSPRLLTVFTTQLLAELFQVEGW